MRSMEIPKSTVRFAQVAKECGRPEPLTLWSDPEKDPAFQAAVQRSRVMTVVQETVGTKKDFGVVGFHRVEHASYWIFPKSLREFEGKRVIGIKYDLLNVPKPKEPVTPTAERAKKAQAKHVEKLIKEPARRQPHARPPEKAEPKLHRYRVLIRTIATAEDEREVDAKSAKEAEDLALKKAAADAAHFPAEGVSREIVGVRRVKT